VVCNVGYDRGLLLYIGKNNIVWDSLYPMSRTCLCMFALWPRTIKTIDEVGLVKWEI